MRSASLGFPQSFRLACILRDIPLAGQNAASTVGYTSDQPVICMYTLKRRARVASLFRYRLALTLLVAAAGVHTGVPAAATTGTRVVLPVEVVGENGTTAAAIVNIA